MRLLKVGVVGGGLAGLAAGTTLADSGCEVEIFERSRLLGGRATSFEIGGEEVDNGQHVFLACCDAFQDFVRRADSGDRLYVQDRFEALVIDRGKVSTLKAGDFPPPWHLAASLLRFAHLGVRSKIGIAKALRAAAANGTSGGTFADWLAEQRQTDEAIRTFWKPFFVPALNVSLDEMDADEAIFTLRTAFLQSTSAARFGFTTVPLARIAEAAAERVARVHRSTSVASLELAGDRVSALTTTTGERRAFDAFVLAVTPPQLLRLLGTAERYGVAALDRYRPHPIVDVHLFCAPNGPASRALLGGAFTFAALVDSPIQWVFKKRDGYLVCSISAADEQMRRSTAELIDFAWSELQTAIPALQDASLSKAAVTRNPEATFSASAGAVRPGPATAVENLYLAGSWTATGWPDTMESAVRSGIAAAERIVGAAREVSTKETRS